MTQNKTAQWCLILSKCLKFCELQFLALRKFIWKIYTIIFQGLKSSIFAQVTVPWIWRSVEDGSLLGATIRQNNTNSMTWIYYMTALFRYLPHHCIVNTYSCSCHRTLGQLKLVFPSWQRCQEPITPCDIE